MDTSAHELSPPSLEDIAHTLQSALEENYARCSVTVTECPDLTQEPFNLAFPGLTGNEVAADIGGQPHLFPKPLLEKKYSLIECAKAMHMSPEQGGILGAGAGPFHVIGKNAELAPNISWHGDFDNVTNKTQFAAVTSRDKATGRADVELKHSPSTDFALMMNLFGCEGKIGPVLKITARSRTGGGKSLTEFVRHALLKAYGENTTITLGGVFVMRRGKAQFHVMPDFPGEEELPWKDRHVFNDWLTYHHFAAPIVCLTVFHSCDCMSLGLRMEHTHCYSADGKSEGGHYHYDLAPGEDDAEEVEYEAYFNTAKTIYRIDRPEVTLQQDLHAE